MRNRELLVSVAVSMASSFRKVLVCVAVSMASSFRKDAIFDDDDEDDDGGGGFNVSILNKDEFIMGASISKGEMKGGLENDDDDESDIDGRLRVGLAMMMFVL